MYIEVVSQKSTAFDSPKSVIGFLLVSLIILTVILIGAMTYKNKISLMLSGTLKNINDNSSDEVLEEYFITEAKILNEKLKWVKYYIGALIVVVGIFSLSSIYNFTEAKANNIVYTINAISNQNLEEKDVQKYVNLDTNRVDLYKIDNSYFKIINNKLVNIKNPKLLDKV